MRMMHESITVHRVKQVIVDEILEPPYDGRYGFCLGCGHGQSGHDTIKRWARCDACDTLGVVMAEEVLDMIFGTIR